MEVQFISLELIVLQLITHVLEPYLNTKQVALVCLGVTDVICHIKPALLSYRRINTRTEAEHGHGISLALHSVW